MKTLNLVTKATLATLLIVSLSACGKKKGGSSAAVAATPGSTGYIACPATGYYQNPTTGQTQYCQPGQQVYVGTGTTGQQICPQNGYIQTQYGMQQCVPGQYVQVGTNVGGQQQDGCSYWTQKYGVPYYPQMVNGRMMCVIGGY